MVRHENTIGIWAPYFVFSCVLLAGFGVHWPQINVPGPMCGRQIELGKTACREHQRHYSVNWVRVNGSDCQLTNQIGLDRMGCEVQGGFTRCLECKNTFPLPLYLLSLGKTNSSRILAHNINIWIVTKSLTHCFSWRPCWWWKSSHEDNGVEFLVDRKSSDKYNVNQTTIYCLNNITLWGYSKLWISFKIYWSHQTSKTAWSWPLL